MLSMSRTGRGDTIVEVLLAIAIAAFGVGTTYATAARSLNQAITAREHNEALNLIENQITDLRLQFKNDPSTFDTKFGSSPGHYCLTDTATAPITNTFTGSATPDTLSSPPYNSSGCTYNKAGDGVTYYIDIVATRLSSPITVHPTVFQIFVRWYRIGGGQINQTSNFIRINGPTPCSGATCS